MTRALMLMPICAILLTVGLADANAQQPTTQQPTAREQAWQPEDLQILQRLDINRDGILHPTEVPDVAKSFVADLVRRMGRSALQPLPLKDFESAAQPSPLMFPLEIVARLDRNQDGHLTPEEIPAEAQAFVQRVAREASCDHQETISLKVLRTNYQAWLATRPLGSPAAGTASRLEPADIQAAAKHAENLIRLYDRNQDGVLEASEWSRLHEDWGQADRNGNGKLEGVEVAFALFKLKR